VSISSYRVKKIMWGLLALAESLLAFVLAHAAILNMLRIVLTRKAVLTPNFWYFAGMFFGDLIKMLIPGLLIYHAIGIVRRLLNKALA
jgi:hypothetical protein